MDNMTYNYQIIQTFRINLFGIHYENVNGIIIGLYICSLNAFIMTLISTKIQNSLVLKSDNFHFPDYVVEYYQKGILVTSVIIS